MAGILYNQFHSTISLTANPGWDDYVSGFGVEHSPLSNRVRSSCSPSPLLPMWVARLRFTIGSPLHENTCGGQPILPLGRTTIPDVRMTSNMSEPPPPNEDFGPSKKVGKTFVRTFHTPKYAFWAESDEKCFQNDPLKSFSTFPNRRLGNCMASKRRFGSVEK